MRSTLLQTARTARPPRAATLLLCLSALFVAGCVYRMPIQQGNLLDPSQVEQLEEGMTRTQVSFLLGTPMVPPGFDDSRWDYYYYVKVPRLREPYTRRLTVFFENDKVVRFEKMNIPDVPKTAAAPDAVNPGAQKVEPPKNISATEAPQTVARPEVSDGGNATSPGAGAGTTSERVDK
jgi:outer membrane protein assembly factor BamE